jgi:hypothetical protein
MHPAESRSHFEESLTQYVKYFNKCRILFQNKSLIFFEKPNYPRATVLVLNTGKTCGTGGALSRCSAESGAFVLQL